MERASSHTELVDVHAHMSDHAFAHDLVDVLERAADVGVVCILAVSETVEEAENIGKLCQHHQLVKPCAGLYPTILDTDAADAMIAYIQAHRAALVAIGEVGLDYRIVEQPDARALQREILVRQIKLAKELDLPLNVHSRSAGHYAISLLREHGAERVLMHAFDGKVAAAREGIDAGYYFSIPPSVVRSRQKQKLVRGLPLKSLLLESDSPALGPDKQKRNEPANVVIARDAIAELKEVSPEEVGRITSENARRLFPRAFNR